MLSCIFLFICNHPFKLVAYFYITRKTARNIFNVRKKSQHLGDLPQGLFLWTRKSNRPPNLIVATSPIEMDDRMHRCSDFGTLLHRSTQLQQP